MSNVGKTPRQVALWLDAGKTLAQDATARVVCPSCGLGILQVKDVAVWNGERIERWMRCDHCGTANTVLMSSQQARTDIASADVGEKLQEQADAQQPFDWNDSKAVDQLVNDAVKAIRERK